MSFYDLLYKSAASQPEAPNGHLIKESKAAWLKVLQGLKGTSKTQAKMKELSNLWGSGSRTRNVSETLADASPELWAPHANSLGVAKAMLRNHSRDLNTALQKAQKGVFNPGSGILARLRSIIREPTHDAAGALWQRNVARVLSRQPQAYIRRGSNKITGYDPLTGVVHLPSESRQYAEAIAEGAPSTVLPHVWAEKVVLPHGLTRWSQYAEKPKKFMRNTRLGLNDIETAQRRIGIRPATFWDDAFHQSDSTAVWGKSDAMMEAALPSLKRKGVLGARINPLTRTFDATTHTRAANDALAYGGPSAAHSFRIGTALRGSDGILANNPITKELGDVANTPAWRGLSGIYSLIGESGMPYVKNVRRLP